MTLTFQNPNSNKNIRLLSPFQIENVFDIPYQILNSSVFFDRILSKYKDYLIRDNAQNEKDAILYKISKNYFLSSIQSFGNRYYSDLQQEKYYTNVGLPSACLLSAHIEESIKEYLSEFSHIKLIVLDPHLYTKPIQFFFIQLQQRGNVEFLDSSSLKSKNPQKTSGLTTALVSVPIGDKLELYCIQKNIPYVRNKELSIVYTFAYQCLNSLFDFVINPTIPNCNLFISTLFNKKQLDQVSLYELSEHFYNMFRFDKSKATMTEVPVELLFLNDLAKLDYKNSDSFYEYICCFTSLLDDLPSFRKEVLYGFWTSPYDFSLEGLSQTKVLEIINNLDDAWVYRDKVIVEKDTSISDYPVTTNSIDLESFGEFK